LPVWGINASETQINFQVTLMKNKILTIVPVFLFFAGACQKEDPLADKPTGILQVNIGLFISVNEVSSQLKSTLATEDFKVVIFNVAGEEVREFAKASEMPATIELEVGEYYVTAHSDNNLPAAFENPYYYGRSEPFTITAGASQTITVNCELANVMVTVIYSEKVKSSFSDFSCTVSSSAGSLTFTREETRAGYFQVSALNIAATLTRTGPGGSPEIKILTGSIPAPLPKKHYEIHVDAAATPGIVLLDIRLDEVPVPVEIVDITGNNDVPVTGNLNAGDLLISEIMYDPTALTDADGEWFELYNNTSHTVDLNNLVIKKNDTESHIIKGPFILAAHGYCVLARTENAVPGTKYLYNSSITLNNTGCLLAVCNYGTNGTDGSVICAVNYGNDGFPKASGATICLDPEIMTLASVVTGNSWCISKSIFTTGDLGTPGSVNDPCN
jgi:hypothetical protein